MALPQREVVVNGHRYKFHLIGGSQAFKSARAFTTKVTTLLPCIVNGKIDEFNSRLMEVVMEDLDSLIDVFINKNALYCDDRLIQDFDEHFAGRFTEIPQLLFKVIMENDKDFFHYLPSLIEKALHTLNEKLQANSLPKAEDLDKALTEIANNVKSNLS